MMLSGECLLIMLTYFDVLTIKCYSYQHCLLMPARYVFVYLFDCLFVCLYVFLFVFCVFFCLFACLFVCPSGYLKKRKLTYSYETFPRGVPRA